MSDLQFPSGHALNEIERDADASPHRSPPIGGTQRRALRCGRCTGNIYLTPVAPGLFDLECLSCGRSAGDVTEHELITEHGLTKAQTRALEARVFSFLWVRES